MRISDLKNELNISENEFNVLILNLGLSEIDEIDDYFAKNIIDSYKDKLQYPNESSLEAVKIYGLFNKHDYFLNFDSSINIFVGENGHGKTTIIKIIVAALRNDIKTLNKLPFNKIDIFYHDNEVVTIENISKKREKNKYLETFIYDSEKYENYYLDLEELDEDLLRFKGIYLASRSFKKNNLIPLKDFLHELRHLYFMQEISKMHFNRCMNYLLDDIENEKSKEIVEEIKYLPTFRRVEAEMKELYNEDFEVEKHIKGGSLKFGLSDVDEKIQELVSRLKEQAHELNGELAKEVLTDLLENKPLTITGDERSEITYDKIRIVTGRIGKEKMKNVEKLYDYFNRGSIDLENQEFLEYYLYKLVRIYNSQSHIDKKIKRFVEICNKYLINKKIIFEEATPKVIVVDKEDSTLIKFNELSSGEKQIISIFSELYLIDDNNPMIYIIDEPELSLSIPWQKYILEDIYNSGRVKLLIATTHSPFIFKNKFSKFAKDLSKFRLKRKFD